MKSAVKLNRQAYEVDVVMSGESFLEENAKFTFLVGIIWESKRS